MGSKTNESLIHGIIFLGTEEVGRALPIKNAFRKEMKEDLIINHELSKLSASVALKFGRGLAVANATMITAKQIDYDSLWGTFIQILGTRKMNQMLHSGRHPHKPMKYFHVKGFCPLVIEEHSLERL